MTTRSSIEVLLLVAAAALTASVGRAQSFGDIRGTLFDSAGAVMPDCSIIVKNQDTNQIRRATSTDAGVYAVPNLVPGAYQVHAEKSLFQGGTRVAESISVSGERLEFNYYTIDGVANQDVNYNSYIVRPSIEALLEFKVLTRVFPAEYGREPSQILMATRSGTNAYHATAFEFLRNSALDAKIWNQVGAKNPFRRNDFGFTLAGPILK